MADGPGGNPPVDRYGRDAHRHPMVWDDTEPCGGFSSGSPWLSPVEIDGGGVAQQRVTEDSMLALYRDLIAARRRLGEGLTFLDLGDGVLAYRRGERHVVAINISDKARQLSAVGTVGASHGRWAALGRCTGLRRDPRAGGGGAPRKKTRLGTGSGGQGFVTDLRR